MKSTIINLVSFKAGWIAVVASAAANAPAVGALAAATVIAFHLSCIRNARAEGLLLLSAATIGLVWESLLVSSGYVQYHSGFMLPGMAPYWIVAMWVLFATTLNVGMRWLRGSVWIAAIAGAIGGPLAFLAGQKMGAVTFTDPVAACSVIGLGWALLLPFLVRIALRFDGQAPPQPAADLAFSMERRS